MKVKSLSRPGLCAIAPGRRAGAPPHWQLARFFPGKKLDTTERLHFHFSLSCIGEGHGNPLQCPCLENPRDGGAWWAAVYGVAQSQTARRGSQGASRAAPGKSGLHARGEGERVLALESREGTRASRRIEEGLSRSFSGGGGKPSCPSPSAGDAKLLQLCPTLCDPIDGSPPGSPVPGILQARTLE